MPAGEIELGERRREACGVGVGADHRSFGLAQQRVHRTDAVAHPAGVVDQIECRDLVRHGDVAAAPGRIGPPTGDEARQVVWRDFGRAVIRVDPERSQPEAVISGDLE